MASKTRFPIRIICIILLALFGLFLTVHLTTSHFLRKEIRKQVLKYIILQPGRARDSYERFVGGENPDAEAYYTKFYFLNITNLDEVRKGQKPVLEELGPYTYRTVEEKYDVSFHYNGSLSYRERAFYYEEPEMTVGKFNDNIVTANLVLSGVLDRVYAQSGNYFVRLALSSLARALESGSGKNQGLFLKRTVDELLWGYDETILDLLSRIPQLHVNQNFSLFHNSTETDPPGPLSMIDTGLNVEALTGELMKWDGLREVKGWNAHNESVHGTMGEFFKPFLKNDEDLTIWIPEMYRAMDMYRAGNSAVYGVDTYRYRIKPEFWEISDRYYTTYKGLVNATAFSLDGGKGPPLFFSMPHFCEADASLNEAVIGLECDARRHEFFVDVEPNTGISLRGVVRLMVNTEYSPRFTSIDPDLSETVLPIFWMEFIREATESQLATLITAILLAASLVILISGSAIRTKKSRLKNKQRSTLDTQRQENISTPLV